jgi:hypothetical protein
MPDLMKRAELAVQIANCDYTDEYDDYSLLCILKRDGIDGDLTGIGRYLVIATEYAGEGPADKADFFVKKAEAIRHMGEYARSGWASGLYDLDSGSREMVKFRSPR